MEVFPLMRWYSHVRVWASAAAGVLAAVATGYLLYVQLHLDEKGFERHPGWEFWSIVTVGVVSVGSALARPLRAYTISRYEKRRGKVAIALRGIPWAVNKITSGAVPVQPLGASAWVIRWWGPFARLHRIGKERVNDTPGPSRVRWTKGKGVIGQCWATGQVMIVNTHIVDQQCRNYGQDQWGRVKPETRRRLTYPEYRQLAGKYGTVIAVPMFHPQTDKIMGVVAIDSPPGYHNKLNAEAVTAEVCEAAGVIANYLT